MINAEQNVPCPVCGTKIPFDTRQLLAGVQFACPNTECDAQIGLTNESRPVVAATMEKLEDIKRKISK